MSRILTGIFALLLSATLYSQSTSKYNDFHANYKEGLKFFNEKLYGQASKAFEAVLNQPHPYGIENSETILLESKLKYALCALRMDLPQAQKLIDDFLLEHGSDPITQQAQVDIGNYYFDNKDYESALKYYGSATNKGLSREEQNELTFKKGYCYLLKKQFGSAKTQFIKITEDKTTPYYYPANYYAGFCSFQEEKFKDALTYFDKASGSQKYGKEIPYYITQIYFAQKNYDAVLDYAPAKVKESVKNSDEIEMIIGQSYFVKQDYTKALPYFEAYSEKKSKLTPQQVYQIAYTQYKNKKYENAIKNLQQLNDLTDRLGQSALYTLGDCYVATEDKMSAFNAFKRAAAMSHDQALKEEATFNAGKLAFELENYAEALQLLNQTPKNSSFYNEAQTTLSKLFLQTKDYENAITTMESMPTLSTTLQEAYQKVCLFKGMQQYNDTKFAPALVFFNKSLRYNVNKDIQSLSNYWIGQTKHAEKDYVNAIGFFQKYLTSISSPSQPEYNASKYEADYAIGHSLMKKKDYKKATEHFLSTVKGIQSNNLTGDNYFGKQILSDAQLNLGDCYLSANDYVNALKYYDQVIAKKGQGYDYALYQKAIIKGITEGESINKILLLEDIADNHPNSPYADDALFQLGKSYFAINKLNEAKNAQSRLTKTYGEQSPLYNSSLLQLGLISANQGLPDEALGYYKKVFENNLGKPIASEALPLIEEIYVKSDRTEDYFKYIESIKGYKITDAKKEQLSFKVAEDKYLNADYPNAIKSLGEYLANFPSGKNTLYGRLLKADAHYRLKEYDAALVDFDKIISLGQSQYYEDALEYAADLSYNYKVNFEKAFNYYQAWYETTSSPSSQRESLLGMVRSSYRMGNQSNSLKYSQQIIANPDATAIEKAEANYYKAKIAFDQKDWDTASAGFQSVINFKENNARTAEARYRIANIAFKKNNISQAETLILENNPYLSDYKYWLAKNVILLGDIYTLRKEYFNAKAAYETVIENFKDDKVLVDEASTKLTEVKAAEAKDSKLEIIDPNATLELDTND